MPNLDKTGPTGRGPRTGRGRGNCNQTSTQAGVESQPSRPLGRGLRRIFGWGRRRNTE